MVKIARLDDAFLEVFLTASKPSRRWITAAKRKEKEKKERRKKTENRKALRHNFDFCACPSQNVAKRDASGKKDKLSWCKCIFDQIKGNLAEIQPKTHQNVQETPFSQKAPGVNGLNSSKMVIIVRSIYSVEKYIHLKREKLLKCLNTFL